jgi:serine palmitoyltransferase
VDILVGSVATGLSAGGGFCAGSQVVVHHQRINGTAFVFSASMPGLLATSASEGINILRNTPSLLTTLQENVRAVHAVLDKVEVLEIPSHPASPIIHLHIRTPATSSLNPSSAQRPGKPNNTQIALPGPPPFDIEAEEHALQEIADECLAQGVLVTRAKRLRGQEMVETRPSIRLAISAALSRKDIEKSAQVIKAAAVKVLSRRR